MITAEHTFFPQSSYPIDRIGSPEQLLFFDIETTGFSGASSNLYLIGAASVRDGAWHLIQWFADRPGSEEEILQAFFSYLEPFSALVHFNGDTFDIPYLKKRCQILGLPCPLDRLKSVDIYKRIRPMKKLLGLDSLKQKAVEKFLGISREDVYTGGQLIQVYEDYLETGDEERLRLLLLHNEDDLKGMPKLLPILAYPDFLSGPFSPVDCSLREETDLFGQSEPVLEAVCRGPASLPRPFSWEHSCLPGAQFEAEGGELRLSIPLFRGELKYFYPNYRDYYYLIYEDTAIHKSVGEYVDRSARKKATAATCYTKKEGLFLPLPDSSCGEPLFRLDYRSRTFYMEIPEELLTSPDFPRNLVRWPSFSSYLRDLTASSLGKAVFSP